MRLRPFLNHATQILTLLGVAYLCVLAHSGADHSSVTIEEIEGIVDDATQAIGYDVESLRADFSEIARLLASVEPATPDDVEAMQRQVTIALRELAVAVSDVADDLHAIENLPTQVATLRRDLAQSLIGQRDFAPPSHVGVDALSTVAARIESALTKLDSELTTIGRTTDETQSELRKTADGLAEVESLLRRR